ncbi:MAG TPA: mechanosensitive ion channel [Chitinophagaceae bacterium]|nr:mechanosensitive ion channel [Chitinophagaceae bacterium]HRF17055.1 mechanosensitive ion channel [Chitinophagaceae bacterium]
MNDFLEQIWWGNPVKNYFITGGIILFVWLLKKFISRYFAGLLFRVVHSIWKDVDKKSFVNLVVKPLGFFLLILVSIVTLYKLNFPEELNPTIYKYTIKEIVHCFGTIILIVSFIGLLLRIIDFIALILEKRANLTPDQTDNQLIVFFKDFFKVILVIIGVMLVLRFAFDQNIGGLLTGLSIVGAAIALALRESIENLIASFIIFFDKPFVTGDLVKVQNITGTVERIGLRSTRIRTDQKTYVTVPNKQMVDSILDNLSLRTQRRADLKLELGLNTPAAVTEQFIGGIEKILSRKEIESYNVHLSDITHTALVIVSDYYTAPVTIKEFNQLKQEVNLQSLRLMEELKIEIAGASTDIRLQKQD